MKDIFHSLQEKYFENSINSEIDSERRKMSMTHSFEMNENAEVPIALYFLTSKYSFLYEYKLKMAAKLFGTCSDRNLISLN